MTYPNFVHPGVPKIAGTEMNQHSGDTLASQKGKKTENSKQYSQPQYVLIATMNQLYYVTYSQPQYAHTATICSHHRKQ
jgi:hypothetical protein